MQVVREFDLSQRSLLLKFVTSCSRQPLLGFASLAPSFAVQQVRLAHWFIDSLIALIVIDSFVRSFIRSFVRSIIHGMAH